MMIDDAKLNELLALAEKATPGPYWAEGREVFVRPSLAYNIPDTEHDAKLVAACDPATIIAIVQELKEKRFRLASLEK